MRKSLLLVALMILVAAAVTYSYSAFKKTSSPKKISQPISASKKTKEQTKSKVKSEEPKKVKEKNPPDNHKNNFLKIKAKVRFEVLYPTYLPSGFTLVQGLENPRINAASGEDVGFFEVTYSQGNKDIRIGEGSFNAGEESLSGRQTKAGPYEVTVSHPLKEENLITWSVGSVNYALQTKNLSESETLKIVSSMRTL